MYQNYGWKYVLTAFIAVLWGFALWMNPIALGLDLRGGDELIYRLDFGGEMPDPDVTEKTAQLLQERIDILGVKELSIRSMGNDKVVIQVPGATQLERERIKTQIEKAGKLQFKILITDQLSAQAKQAEIERIIREKRLGTWDEQTARYDIARWHGSAGRGAIEEYALLYNRTPTGKPLYVSGENLADAYRAMDDKNLPAVGFEWDSVGAKRFGELTAENINRSLAVVLDDEIRSAPVIRSQIGKKGIIEGGDGGWDDKELNSLIVILKAGSLPAKPILAYSKHVGPQLGKEAVTFGSLAIGGALAVILLFMLYYYRVRNGLVANIALALNLFLILGTLSMFGATLTLPGIAGILLTAGMAVDANILIFERIREEVAKGSAIKQAVQIGYDRAFWTIFDANLTTALTAVVLMYVGTGPIKGFGITLTIGILTTMFTALFVTRALYGYFVAKEFIHEANFRQLFAKPSFDFFSSSKKFIPISITVICVGWVVFLYRGQEKYGIDFTGGTVMTMRLETPMAKDEVQGRLDQHFEQVGKKVLTEVQRVGEGSEAGSRQWQLRTRMVGAEGLAETEVSARDGGPGLLDALLPAAHAQGDAAPAEGDDAADPATPADGDQAADPATPTDDDAADPATPTDAAPQDGDPATGADEPTEPAPAAAAQPASAEIGGASAQDFFEEQVRSAFREELIDPYPALDGQPFVAGERAADGSVPVSFQANLVPLGAGLTADAPPLTVDLVRELLPRALRDYAADLTARQAMDAAAKRTERRGEDELIALYTRLAGPEGGQPAFEITALPDADTADQVVPFRFTLDAKEIAPADTVAAFKDALEKAQEEEYISFAPAVAFPTIDQVGAAVAKNLKSKALIATFFCVVFICLYVWLRFDLWSGIAAIVAVFHDVLVLLAFLTVLDMILGAAGSTFDVKFSLITITAFLTLVGYSINDTIVILDRIREDKALGKAKGYTPEVVNDAINKTLSRTVLTSLTTWLVIAVLFVASFFGLSSLQGLSVALLFGILAGTYSTVWVATPILLMDKRKVTLTLWALAGFLVITGIGSFGSTNAYIAAGGLLVFWVGLPVVLTLLGAGRATGVPVKG